MDWVTGAQLLLGAVLIILFWVVLRLVIEGIYYLQFNAWWPIRILIFPIFVCVVLLGAMAAAATARDVRDWWNDRR